LFRRKFVAGDDSAGAAESLRSLYVSVLEPYRPLTS